MSEPASDDQEINLGHYLDVLLRRRWIVLAILVVSVVTALLIAFTTQPIYQASTMLVIEKEKGSGSVYSNGAMVENSDEDYYQTQYKLLQSDSLTQKVYDDLGLQQERDFAQPHGLEKLHAAITIAPVIRSRLVYVRVESHSASLAARIANAIADGFVAQNLSNQLFISKDVLQALQLKKGSTRQTYEALPAVVNNPLIQTLKGEYAKLDAQVAQMSQQFTPRFPGMIAARSNMAALKAQIDAETDKIVASLKTELSGQLQGNNVRIIDPAKVPELPIKPRKRLIVLAGIFLGALIGFGAALLVETLDQTIRTQEDVERRVGLPFLGIIPRSSDASPEVPVYSSLISKELSLTSEALRNLRTMVDFAGVSQRSQVFLVTSSIQEEGKSFVAANLAVAMAQLGERVLIIDGDLRRPTVHKKFHISSETGLSDFLAKGTKVDELEGLLAASAISGLSILPCGHRPPNPSELLNTPRLGALTAWAKSNFDRIVVDCTPMFPINDTLLWGRHIGSAVFVVRYGTTRMALVNNATQKLKATGIKVLGVALNSAMPSGLSYASYGHYYQSYYDAYHEAPSGQAS